MTRTVEVHLGRTHTAADQHQLEIHMPVEQKTLTPQGLSALGSYIIVYLMIIIIIGHND